MQQMKIVLLLLLVFVIFANKSFSQTNDNGAVLNRPLTTAVPFLLIAPDARGGAMGDLGAATSPDAYSMYYNPAKYAFIEKDFGFAVSYVPWLRALVNDIGLSSVSGFKKFGDKQAIAFSLRFFSMGSITFTDDVGTNLGEVKPNEFTIDGTYSRKFSRVISCAVAGRFIYSNLIPAGTTIQNNYSKPGTSVAADIALYGHKEIDVKGLTATFLDFGLNISNIGSKISYSSSSSVSNFIPTNLRVGLNYAIDVDEYNRISLAFDLNKLLVPTPPTTRYDSATSEYVIIKGKNPDVSPIKGIIQSFYDAPGGFQEELQEINICAATEYWYNKLFAVRAGYFYEAKNKGNRQFFTIGAGLRYNVFGLDFSYLIPIQSNNPLQNTMQFTLLFNFDKPGAKDKQESKETKQ
jgi:hypothetical protein